MRDEICQDEASVHRSNHLLNDCKIIPAFLNLEKRKAGYSNICKHKLIMVLSLILTKSEMKAPNSTKKFTISKKLSQALMTSKISWNPIMTTQPGRPYRVGKSLKILEMNLKVNSLARSSLMPFSKMLIPTTPLELILL